MIEFVNRFFYGNIVNTSKSEIVELMMVTKSTYPIFLVICLFLIVPFFVSLIYFLEAYPSICFLYKDGGINKKSKKLLIFFLVILVSTIIFALCYGFGNEFYISELAFVKALRSICKILLFNLTYIWFVKWYHKRKKENENKKLKLALSIITCAIVYFFGTILYRWSLTTNCWYIGYLLGEFIYQSLFIFFLTRWLLMIYKMVNKNNDKFMLSETNIYIIVFISYVINIILKQM